MKRQVDEVDTLVTSRRRPKTSLLALLVLLGGGLSACAASSKPETSWEGVLATKDLAMVVPYIEDGEKSFYDNNYVPYYGGNLAGLGVATVINMGFLFADLADKSDIGRHLSVFEVDGREDIYEKRELLLSPGRHRLGVKHCHDGTLKPPCSQLVNLEFEAKGGMVYELVLMDGRGVLLREVGTGLPAAWGDAEAVTADAYQVCVIEEAAGRKRGDGTRQDEGNTEADVVKDAESHCQEAHPASYQASLAP